MHVKLAPPTHTLPSMKRIDRIPSPDGRPLGGFVRWGCLPRVDEPLGDARVDAPANGIFASTDRQREGPHLELLGGSFGTPTNNPENELTHAGIVRFEARTSAALAKRTAAQPGPLSTQL